MKEINCMDLQKDMQGSCSETCPMSNDANQVTSIKVENVSDTEEEEDPVPLKYSGIKSEHEDKRESSSETCPTSHDANEIISVKVEGVSYVEKEENHVELRFSGIKIEHENCMDLEKDVPVSWSQTFPVSSHDADQFINTKVEEISDVEEEGDPELITFPQIKAIEHEDFTRNWITSYFSWKKILETPIFLELFSWRRFHLLLKFLHFVDNKSSDRATCSSERLYKLKCILDHLNAKFRSVYTPECNVSVDVCCTLFPPLPHGGRLLEV